MRPAYLKIVAVSAVLALAGFGCEPDTSTQVLLVSPDAVPGQIAPAVSKTIARSFGSDVTMALHGSFDYKDGLHMELVSVSDTKCPAGTKCTFDGELSPLLRLTGGAIGSEAKEVTLTWESNKIAKLNGYVLVLEGATTTTARVTVNKMPAAPGTAVADAKTDAKPETPSAPVTTTKPELVEMKATTAAPTPPPTPQVADNSLGARMRSSWLIRWLFGDPELRKQQEELERQATAATTPVVTTTTVPKTSPKPTVVPPSQQQASNTNVATTPSAPPIPPPQTTSNGTPVVDTAAINAPPPKYVEPSQPTPSGDTQPKSILDNVVDAVTTVVHTVVDAIVGDKQANTGSTLSPTGEAIEIIRIAGPNANQVIGSPVIIDGEARGSWFYDGKFPVKLLDASGKVLAVSEAQAVGAWASSDTFVKYQLQLNFQMATAPTGILILFKGTGQPTKSEDPAISIPVRFGEYSTTTKAK